MQWVVAALFPCVAPGAGLASWAPGAGQIRSSLDGYCLASDLPNEFGTNIVFNEFGNGELTIYGPQVVTSCVGVANEPI